MANSTTIFREVNDCNGDIAGEFCNSNGDFANQVFVFNQGETARLMDHINSMDPNSVEIITIDLSEDIDWETDERVQVFKEINWFSPEIVANILGSGGNDCEEAEPGPDDDDYGKWCPDGTGWVVGGLRFLFHL